MVRVKEVDQRLLPKTKIDEMKSRAVSVVVINLKTKYELARDREAASSSFNQQRGET